MNFKLIALFLLLTVCSLSAQAKMYKWKDEEGNTHFGDKIPTKYLAKEHKELNQQGAVMETHEEIKVETKEERKERLELEKIAKEKEKADKAQAKRDRVLLDTYTTKRDLTAARDARLDAVASQLQLSESIIDRAKREIVKTENKIKTSGGEVEQKTLDKLEREKKQLATHQEVAAGHELRKKKITEQFKAYIKRFLELKANQQRIKDEREARRKEALEM